MNIRMHSRPFLFVSLVKSPLLLPFISLVKMVTTKDMQRGARSSIVAICLVLRENMHDLHSCEGLRGWKKPQIPNLPFFKAVGR